jgi:hypothetical protein
MGLFGNISGYTLMTIKTKVLLRALGLNLKLLEPWVRSSWESNFKFLTETRRGVSHTVALQFTLKSILRQKNNYGNSNISACKNIIFKKIL